MKGLQHYQNSKGKNNNSDLSKSLVDLTRKRQSDLGGAIAIGGVIGKITEVAGTPNEKREER